MQQPDRPISPLNGHVATNFSCRTRGVPVLSVCLQLVFSSLMLIGAGHAQAAATSTAVSQSQPNAKSSMARPRINVVFEKIDSENHIILKYGTLVIKTSLAGVKIQSGAAGVLGMLLPAGSQLQAEVIKKGAIPSVVLWKGKVNLNEQLLVQGVAEGVR